MKYTVYKTVSLINGEFYIGVHKTNDPNDEYLGSGKVIRRAVLQHGPENFRKDILAVFDNSEAAYLKEDELIRVHANEILCLNLRISGRGGWDYVNSRGLNGAGKGGLALKKRLQKEPELLATFQSRAKEHRKLVSRDHILAAQKLATESAKTFWKDLVKSAKTRQRLSVLHEGERNSQFGTYWITNGIRNRKLSKSIAVPIGWWRGRI